MTNLSSSNYGIDEDELIFVTRTNFGSRVYRDSSNCIFTFGDRHMKNVKLVVYIRVGEGNGRGFTLFRVVNLEKMTKKHFLKDFLKKSPLIKETFTLVEENFEI